MVKAFKASFHRFDQRCRPVPVGSRLMSASYTHFRAGCCASGSVLGADTLANRRGPHGDLSYETTRFCPEDVVSQWDELGWSIDAMTTIVEPARVYGRLPARIAPPDAQPAYAYYLVAARSR
jgi:hypothetical protein